jgi:ComF family protein
LDGLLNALWNAPRSWPRVLAECLLEVLYPETCQLCGQSPEGGKWCATGAVVKGVWWSDRPHLCLSCLRKLLSQEPPARSLSRPGAEDLPALGGMAIGPELTRLVGAWKYSGIRGLAWPLAEALTQRIRSEKVELLAGAGLIPVPLHWRRQCQRGFNQAEVLARLLGRATGLPVMDSVARRVRSTAQQARIEDRDRRRQNLQGAFRVRPPRPGESRPLFLVDDLVTSGATILSLARACSEAGWEVRGGIALGVARSHEG